MWRVLIFSSILVAIKVNDAAELFCLGLSFPCMYENITNLASTNDPITVVGVAPTSIDYTTFMISINQNNLAYFPAKIFDIFLGLSSVYIHDDSFVNMETNSLGTCGPLSDLKFEMVKFTQLPAGFAQNCRNLKTLGITQSLLADIDPNAFQGLVSLQTLLLSSNAITCLPPGVFSSLVELKFLYLDSNKITAFDPSVFAGLPKLWRMSLAKNAITYIPILNLNGTSATASNFIIFDISDNPLIAIHPQFLTTLFDFPPDFEVMLSGDLGSVVSCIRQSFGLITRPALQMVDDSLKSTCYSSYTPDMDQQLLPCAPTTTTSTTTTTTTAAPTQATALTSSSTAAPNTPPCSQPPCCDSKVLELILHVVRNVSINFD